MISVYDLGNHNHDREDGRRRISSVRLTTFFWVEHGVDGFFSERRDCVFTEQLPPPDISHVCCFTVADGSFICGVDRNALPIRRPTQATALMINQTMVIH
ncbi:hypothetical protein I4U23_008514 [Adineta vaga]|nr:hypothetical protein I4U23_008514 [Adineta vaga]